LAPRAHCWLMVTLPSTRTPRYGQLVIQQDITKKQKQSRANRPGFKPSVLTWVKAF